MEIGIVKPVAIVDEMRTAYLDYAMSVIVSRALPDARDGLKPVQRRILYAMFREGLLHNVRYSKCAGVVGEVLKKYHPHGDSSVYDALVRLAQPWNMRYPLVDGQGNFGCFTGDTKIKLLDGTEKSFEELAQLPYDEIFYVYSVDQQGKIVVGEGRSSRITRRQAQLIELTFDDGSVVRCTPDHKFMLRDQTWKEAQHLTIDDSLMAGYFDSKNPSMVLQPQTGAFETLNLTAISNAKPLATIWNSENQSIVQYTSRLLAQFGSTDLSAALYDAQRTEKIPSSLKAIQTFGSFEQLVQVASTYNHRVVGLRWLDETADVYDITVNEYHNFMLANGCVVHNSVDGDAAAAYRYTEARLKEIAEELLRDIDRDTVNFGPNFDGGYQEPLVLPARLPNLLLNGSSGIAVGMATNIPPHNLGEICDGISYLVDNPDATVEDLIKFIPGPDFPTGGSILGTEGIVSAYTSGRGRILIRAKAHIEEAARGAYHIVVTELPYQVNKSRLIERIAELVKDKRIEGIRDVRDESDRSGIRMVIILKQDAQPKKVLNHLFKYTSMQTTFGANMLALVEDGKQPRTLSLKKALQEYIEHRQIVIRRRTEFDLAKAKARAHILEGLKIALDQLDEVIATIRASRTAETARSNLMKNFKLSELQSQAILEMQLRRLAGLERKKIEDEYKEVLRSIADFEDILSKPERVFSIIKDDVAELKEKYGDVRRSRIIADATGDISTEDLIPDMNVLVTVTDRGYIKKLPGDTYRVQNRGGRGIKGMTTKEDDVVAHLLMCNTLNDLLFFTNRGKVYQLKVHEVPDASRTAKGLPLVNLISLEPGELVTSLIAVPDFDDGEYLVMTTVKGRIKRTKLSEYSSVRSNGLIAIGLDAGDELRWVKTSNGDEDILMTTQHGQTIRFGQDEVRPMGRPASGVIGIKMSAKDQVVGMDLVRPNSQLLVITSHGMGKRTDLEEYPVKGRATQGVITMRLKPGDIIAAALVLTDSDIVTTITRNGVVMRTRADKISKYGRTTQGVNVINLDKKDLVAAVSAEPPVDDKSDDSDANDSPGTVTLTA
ncbi:DNA gyrase subunit A [Herpetosiphon giganteus]|uniref:DNA gyrase subunit A n=1 Tax=Herpetosiphon giganteus TaxID=2029754 RepID=UPI00195D4566|nr:DNA gyrase subunit A [Herpetosiphon giganteus]MBM7845762.1 DNA gyrase subunit A [Herpetosiphon giganteus]